MNLANVRHGRRLLAPTSALLAVVLLAACGDGRGVSYPALDDPGLTDSIPASLRFERKFAPLEPGQLVDVQVRAINKEGYYADTRRNFPFVWSISDSTVLRPLRVVGFGYYEMRAGRPGSATLTVTLGKITAGIDFTVTDSVFRLSPSSMTMFAGTTQRLLLDWGGTGFGFLRPATFATSSSTNPSVATVDSTGLVSAHSPGAAVISLGYREKTLTAAVTVVANAAPLRFTSAHPSTDAVCANTTAGAISCRGSNAFSGVRADGPGLVFPDLPPMKLARASSPRAWRRSAPAA